VNKDEIRQHILEKRLGLEDEARVELSKVIQHKVLKSSFWPASGRVGLYSPVKNEVRTHTLFQQALEAGLHVYFPRVEKGIDLYEVNGPEDMHRGSWSILEPNRECPKLALDQTLDLLIVPGIAFAKSCYRLGYGKGFYDEYFSRLTQQVPTIGLAYDFQIVETFPLEDWDHSLTGVMTEKNFYTRES